MNVRLEKHFLMVVFSMLLFASLTNEFINMESLLPQINSEYCDILSRQC